MASRTSLERAKLSRPLGDVVLTGGGVAGAAYAACIARRYAAPAVGSLVHTGLERFCRTGSTKGIQAKHAARLRSMLGALGEASAPSDLAVPAWRLHPLKGKLAGHWSLRVDENWRLTFRFVGDDVEIVDYTDYH